MSQKKPIPKENNNYETERLFLRPMSLEDAEFILELYNTPTFIQYIGDRNIRNVEDAEQYVRERFLPQIEKLGFGNYLIQLKSNFKKIGGVGIFEREGLDVMDIGFSLLEEYEGKGYAYEASEKILEIAKQNFGLRKVSAITTKDNLSSQKLIKKLGLEYQKTITLPDENVELMYFEAEV